MTPINLDDILADAATDIYTEVKKAIGKIGFNMLRTAYPETCGTLTDEQMKSAFSQALTNIHNLPYRLF